MELDYLNQERVLEISAHVYALEKEIADRERLYKVGLKNQLPNDELIKLNEEIAELKSQQHATLNQGVIFFMR